MTTPVQTLGPADPKAPGMAKLYAVLGTLLSLGAAAGAFGLITADQVAAIKDLAYQLGLTAGAGVAVVAAFRTRKQLGNGTFDKAPEPQPELPAKQQVANGLQVLVNDAAASTAALSDATELASKVLGLPIVQQGENLVEDFLNTGHKPPS